MPIFHFLITAIALFIPAVAVATEANLALNKPYTLSPRPTPADDGDQTDLTDGRNFRSSSRMWDQKGCVGWYRIKVPAEITVDLGRDEPIRGASFSTSGGSGAVGYPISIALSVSTDGKAFHYAGDLVEMASDATPQYGRTTAHLIQADGMRTHGRFVRFSAVSSTMFLFCDEIEVFRGDDEWLRQPPLDGEVLSESQVIDPLRLTRIGVNRRQKADWAMVRQAVEKDAQANVKDQLLKELDELRKQFNQAGFPRALDGFRAVVPISKLDEQIFAIRGKLLAAGGSKPMSVWHSEPYQLLELLQPIGKVPMPAIWIKMLGNERRAQVFNLTNATAEEQAVPFAIEGMPEGAVHVFQVEYVDTRENRPVATALTPLQAEGGQYTSMVPAGMTRQIWLSFDSTKVPSGQYQGRIHLPTINQQIPLSLEIAAVRLPDQPAMDAMMWDDIFNKGSGITAENQAAAKADLLAHRLNGVWSTRDSTPLPDRKDFDDDGNLIGKINYDKWDAFVKYWPEAHYYFTFAVYLEDADSFAGMKLGTPSCNRALAQWAADWARHNRQLGLKPAQAAICFIDEPRSEVGYTTTYHFIKPFRDGTDEILTMTDPVGIDNAQRLEQARPMLEAVDIIQPTRTGYESADKTVHAAFMQLQMKGKRLWFYSCSGPTRHFDPSYYRMQPWHCFAAGATGQGFWSYNDTGGADSWNPYTPVGQTSYTPVYLSPDNVHSSKHWEALREGIEDYGYLTLLTARQNTDMARKTAQSTVAELAKTYGGYYFAGWNNPSTLAEASRLKVLDQLVP